MCLKNTLSADGEHLNDNFLNLAFYFDILFFKFFFSMKFRKFCLAILILDIICEHFSHFIKFFYNMILIET